MAEFEKLSAKGSLGIYLSRTQANAEAKIVHKEATNILYRTFFDLVNFPKEKKAIFTVFRDECDSFGIDYRVMRGLLDKIWGENDGKKLEYSMEGDELATIGALKFNLPYCDEESRDNRVALSLYERSLPTHTGLFWSFSKHFLVPLFDKYKIHVEAFGMADEPGLLPVRMTLYSDLDNRPRNIGNFFKDPLPPMNYYVNPPYSELLLKKAAEKADSYCRKKRPYTFLIIGPAWKDAEFYQYLLYNPFLVESRLINPAPIFSGGQNMIIKKEFVVFVLSNQKT